MGTVLDLLPHHLGDREAPARALDKLLDLHLLHFGEAGGRFLVGRGQHGPAQLGRFLGPGPLTGLQILAQGYGRARPAQHLGVEPAVHLHVVIQLAEQVGPGAVVLQHLGRMGVFPLDAGIELHIAQGRVF